jgi:hypothetical protein
MKLARVSLLVWICAGCNAGDDTTDGARALCGEGGTINACPEVPHTPEGACWRLVDCAAIPLHVNNMNGTFDWGQCVTGIEQLTDAQQQLVIDCVVASSCDALKPDPKQNGAIACLALGDL